MHILQVLSTTALHVLDLMLASVQCAKSLLIAILHLLIAISGVVPAGWIPNGLLSLCVVQRKQGFAGSPGRLEQNPNAFGQEKSSKGHQVEKLSAANVHPSWVAKRKQKRAFLAASSVCQKCVFGDDDRPVMSVQAPAVAARVLKSSKPASLPAEDLHPSWLAKRAAAFQQAQVPNITSQSKIRFED